jgi:ATP-binding cassette subfamily F protein uup
VAYSDQLREELDPNLTVYESIAEGNDFFDFNGQRKHVISYLRDFLFAPDRARAPIRLLSGGERNRLLLARLFARPSNVLVLDEPTNDLDMETLDLLEELLLEYSGTLLVVSHDRDFLNNVVTSSLVFEGQGRVIEYAGGYDDWLRQRPEPVQEKPERKPAQAKEGRKPRAQGPRKLTFKENKELERLPDRILELETELDDLHTRMGDPEFYKLEKTAIQEVLDREAPLEQEISEAYQRWEELEAVKEAWENRK